jgi:hypothetical protein
MCLITIYLCLDSSVTYLHAFLFLLWPISKQRKQTKIYYLLNIGIALSGREEDFLWSIEKDLPTYFLELKL